MARERLPQLGLAIEVGEQRAQLDRGRLVVEVDLDRGDRAVGLVRRQVRLRELLDDEQALAGGHGAEQALEPRHGLRRTGRARGSAARARAASRWSATARRRGGGRRSRARSPWCRARRRRRSAPTAWRRAAVVAVVSSRCAWLSSRSASCAVLALAREQLRDRVDRRLVTGAVLEVRACSASSRPPRSSTMPTRRASSRRSVELLVGIGLEAELDLAQREQLGHAVLDAEQVREAIDHLEVVRRRPRARCDTCRSRRRCRRARRSRAARRAAACRGACCWSNGRRAASISVSTAARARPPVR